MNKVKEEEGIIAKGKLDIIYAQINPHFLYNTLDAVSALALMEENEKCFEITQALGNFYRNSLNSGLDYITVEDEIDSIKSYITILNMRYDNQIKVDYQIEESVKKEKILKLLLQPLVENAVHHPGPGSAFIKPSPSPGSSNAEANAVPVHPTAAHPIAPETPEKSLQRPAEETGRRLSVKTTQLPLTTLIPRAKLYQQSNNNPS